MEIVFLQINVVILKLRKRTSAEPVNAILNIRTGLKRDNIINHFMIITEFPETVTMQCFIGTSLVCNENNTVQLKVVLMKIIVTIFKFAYFHHYAFFFCVFISALVWFILVFFQAHLVYFRETKVATLMLTSGTQMSRLKLIACFWCGKLLLLGLQ